LDVTGIGATACCHGFFVPTSVVDFQKGEKYASYFKYIKDGTDRASPTDRLIWIIASARPSPTIWKTYPLHS
jgi:hypothetical protein